MNEITVSTSLTFAKGSVGPFTLKMGYVDNVSGKQANLKTQTLGNGSNETLDLGDITTPGFFSIQNNSLEHDAIIADSVAGNDFMRIRPQQVQGPVYLECTAPAGRGDGADVDVVYLVCAR